MRAGLALIVAVAVLAGCGGPRGASPGRSGDEVVVMSSNFTDAKATDWPDRSPDRYPVHGIDLSRFQTQ
ncbi:MAG: glycoside hydrolase, partial [Tabrizicola sp.]